jgi:hypothetical protein
VFLCKELFDDKLSAREPFDSQNVSCKSINFSRTYLTLRTIFLIESRAIQTNWPTTLANTPLKPAFYQFFQAKFL